MRKQIIIAIIVAGAAIQGATALPVGEPPKTPDGVRAAIPDRVTCAGILFKLKNMRENND